MTDDRGPVENDFSGHSGAVVQAGLIQGSVNLRTVKEVPLPSPRQLPPATKGFIDREVHIRQLDSLLDEVELTTDEAQLPVVTISTISGSAGVGKTALAVHWAHRVRERFPDGDIYINLRGYDAVPPLTPHEALDGFLRAMDVPAEKIPRDLHGRAALYRSLTTGRKMLILLDNAATAEQVRPLLPASPSCMVIITSRSRLSGLAVRDGAIRAVLDVLSSQDATRLLSVTIGSERVDRERVPVAKLVELCSYLPLALRIVADRACLDDEMPLTELVEELAAEESRLDALTVEDDELSAVRTVFSWSYKALNAETARVFRLIGIHPGADIALDAAASLTGLAPQSARRHLESLVGLHMLARTGPNRYRLHDLLKLYAAERANLDENFDAVHTARERLLDWYLHHTYAAYQAILPQGRSLPEVDDPPRQSLDEALRWCEKERLNLLDLIRTASGWGQHQFGWQLALAGMAFFELRSYWRAWVDSHLIGLQCARYLGDRLAEGWLLLSLGDAWWDRGDLDEALRSYTDSLRAARDVDDLWTAGFAVRGCGLVYEDREEFQAATRHAQEALDTFGRMGERRGAGLALMSLGNAHRGAGRFAEALASYREAMQVFQRLNNRWSQGLVEFHRGQTLLRTGDHEEALSALTSAAALFRELGDRRHAALARSYEGEAHLKLHDRRAAREALADALLTLLELDDPVAVDVQRRLKDVGWEEPDAGANRGELDG
ncbi:tetratricopeptide repeat protein [Micromonospora violae]|uniref:Tetratricopeptide repeat protein n=1 Tax=Micromonospora violae TaxID=1278207 RepID=A0A4Q7UGQ0_9ACTN|nr:NB-ARC domain-containing protein [Micromonospora violae]RZT80396.1 tetratricopeptide repeat protein [Micromonospora violae]